MGSKPVQFIGRIILGGVFVYAGLNKVLHPLEFEKIITGFKIFPGWMIHVTALSIPWVEIIIGLALIAGIFKKQCAALLTALLAVFIVVISIALFEGTFTGCGCFSTDGGTATVMDGIWIIVRDILFMVPGGVIFFFSKDET